MSGTSHHGKPALAGLFSLCLIAVAVAAEGCDKSQCKGPIRYYEELNCKPVYAKEGDCCAVSYDCSHLDKRAEDKCYANGKEYNIGDALKNEDRSSPCDIGCFCAKGWNNVTTFTCAAVDCFNQMHVKPGCYFKHRIDSCCGGEEVCPKEGEKLVTCEVNGKTYKEGQQFYPSDNLACVCSEGYKGENVEPFCRNITCGIEIKRATEIHDNCPPVFYSNQSPPTSCSFASRCQNDNDTVIAAPSDQGKSATKEVSDDMKCKFGNMTMKIGDELNQATDYSSVCVKCVCEVPPVPTCQRLSDEECDVTKHPNFGV